jgi:hypothetical protein
LREGVRGRGKLFPSTPLRVRLVSEAEPHPPLNPLPSREGRLKAKT